jgi:hypothetical protein
MPRKFNRFTLFIQKFILLINTSTGIPIATARFLEVQLKAETQYDTTVKTTRLKVLMDCDNTSFDLETS